MRGGASPTCRLFCNGNFIIFNTSIILNTDIIPNTNIILNTKINMGFSELAGGDAELGPVQGLSGGLLAAPPGFPGGLFQGFLGRGPTWR